MEVTPNMVLLSEVDINSLTPSTFYHQSQTPLSTRKATDQLCILHDHFKSTLLTPHESVHPTPVHSGLPYNSCISKTPLFNLSTQETESISYCYIMTIDPMINFELNGQTIVKDDCGQYYTFSGLLILSNTSLDYIPSVFFHQNNLNYCLSMKPHPIPMGFVIEDLLLFMKYLFINLLNLYDWFHEVLSLESHSIWIMPKFVRREGQVSYVASMATVLQSFMSSFVPFYLQRPSSLSEELQISRHYSGSLVYNEMKCPSALRIDRLNWKGQNEVNFVHFSTVSKTFDFSSAKRDYDNKEAKLKKLQREAVSEKLKRKDYFRLKQLRHELHSMRRSQKNKEEIIEVNCYGYKTTNVYSDLCQYALLCPIITNHIKFHFSLLTLEDNLQYHFSNKTLLELALTHPSYLSHHNGPPQILNASSHCGIYRGNSQVAMTTYKSAPSKRPKSGIEGLCSAASECNWSDKESDRPRDNERLEFLGDAVIEFLCSCHLYFMFPDLTDGHLVIFRKALICNENLATVAKKWELNKYLKKCSDLNSVDDYSHVLANALEAIIGAIYLDGGLEESKKVVAKLLFPEEDLHKVWMACYRDPLQYENPNGDREMIVTTKLLQVFTSLEEAVGVKFTNIRLLARAFTHPSYGYTNLMLGDYQRMEFLGDAILQLLTSVYVYQSFPMHHEGHLSAFRTAIVHNKQLAKVSKELGFPKYILLGKDQKDNLTEKILADIIESFIAALFIDKGIKHAEVFCQICLFPKLAESAEGLQFLDAKTRLQHAIVYTCKKRGIEVEVPVYRVLSVEGPVNKQIFTVGVYFQGKRLATGTGESSQKGGMDAADKALKTGHILVPSSLRVVSSTPMS